MKKELDALKDIFNRSSFARDSKLSTDADADGSIS